VCVGEGGETGTEALTEGVCVCVCVCVCEVKSAGVVFSEAKRRFNIKNWKVWYQTIPEKKDDLSSSTKNPTLFRVKPHFNRILSCECECAPTFLFAHIPSAHTNFFPIERRKTQRNTNVNSQRGKKRECVRGAALPVSGVALAQRKMSLPAIRVLCVQHHGHQQPR